MSKNTKVRAAFWLMAALVPSWSQAAFHSEESTFHLAQQSDPASSLMLMAICMVLVGSVYLGWRFLFTILKFCRPLQRAIDSLVPGEDEPLPTLILKRGEELERKREVG